MEIKEKSNIVLYVMSASDEFYILSDSDPYDLIMGYDDEEPAAEDSGYTYFLPKRKTYFANFYQGQKITVYLEKIHELKREVYVSQIHWLWMKNMIKSELVLDVKITKRYAGKVTVCELVSQTQIINKAAIKRLSEMLGEKIYVKSL